MLTAAAAAQINFILLLSRQGKLRLAKWYGVYDLKERGRLVKETTGLVLGRKARACNFIEYKDMTIVYKRYWRPTALSVCALAGASNSSACARRRYASLYFVAGIDGEENELLVLETLHRFVETLDRYFENVSRRTRSLCTRRA